ncbi:hypothetical protein JXA56_05900 [Candidatus Micrarchaeota archaeon]|nr:hypothetical protein [Candidatus Micrarchaeota archaeon]
MDFCIEEINGSNLNINPKPPEEFLKRFQSLGWKDGQFIEWDNDNRKLILFDTIEEYSDYKFYKSDSLLRCLEQTHKISIGEYRKRMAENDYNPILMIDQINLFNIGKTRKKPIHLMNKMRRLGWKNGQFVYWNLDQNHLVFFDSENQYLKFLRDRTEKIMKNLKRSDIINWKSFWKIDADIEVTLDSIELNLK